MPYKDKSQQLEYQRKWYSENKKKTIDKVYRRKLNVRKQYQEYKKTFSCTRCSESDPVCIDFHHLRDKKYQVCKMAHSGYSFNLIKKEIAKCIPLCANCHKKEHKRLRAIAKKKLT